MLRFTVALALVGACVAVNPSLDGHWTQFKAHHSKSYSPSEDGTRREIFEANVAKINAHNLRHDLGLTSFRLGLNKFADLTKEEFLAYRGLRTSNSSIPRTGSPQPLFSGKVPAKADWRKKGYVTPIKDQGQCGSCWAFSTTGSLEGQHFKKTGKLVSLSEQNLVDCSGKFGNMGCNGGLMDQAFDYIKANGGIDTEKSYPYTAEDGDCQFKSNAIGAKLRSHVDVKSTSEADLKKAVGTIGPVSVGIDASADSFQLYSEGVYDETECSSTMLDHGVLAVGYDTTKDGKAYWIVKNSWGDSWGQKGYIWMSRNKDNQCGIATAASYPVV